MEAGVSLSLPYLLGVSVPFPRENEVCVGSVPFSREQVYFGKSILPDFQEINGTVFSVYGLHISFVVSAPYSRERVLFGEINLLVERDLPKEQQRWLIRRSKDVASPGLQISDDVADSGTAASDAVSGGVACCFPAVACIAGAVASDPQGYPPHDSDLSRSEVIFLLQSGNPAGGDPSLSEGQKGGDDAGSRPSGKRDLKIGNDTGDTIFVYVDYGGAFYPFRFESSVRPKIQAVYGSSLLDFRTAFVAVMDEPIGYRRQRCRRSPGDCYLLVLNLNLQICTSALPYTKIYRIPCLGHGLDVLPFWLAGFMQQFRSRVQIKEDELPILWVPDSDSSTLPAPTPTTGSLDLLLSSDPVQSWVPFFHSLSSQTPTTGYLELRSVGFDSGSPDSIEGFNEDWVMGSNVRGRAPMNLVTAGVLFLQSLVTENEAIFVDIVHFRTCLYRRWFVNYRGSKVSRGVSVRSGRFHPQLMISFGSHQASWFLMGYLVACTRVVGGLIGFPMPDRLMAVFFAMVFNPTHQG